MTIFNMFISFFLFCFFFFKFYELSSSLFFSIYRLRAVASIFSFRICKIVSRSVLLVENELSNNLKNEQKLKNVQIRY